MPGTTAPENAAPVEAQPTATPEVDMLGCTDVHQEEPVGGSMELPAVEPAAFMQTAAESLPATLNSSSIMIGTPGQTITGVTAMDLVRQMQRSSVGSPVSQRSPDSGKKFSLPAALPSLYKTPC